MSQAAQDRFPIVILGDSFVELANLPTLCGQRVLNAGVSGATVSDVAKFAPQVVLSQHPEMVIVAVGINDAHQDKMTPDANFRASYEAILATIRRSGARAFVIGVPVVSDDRFDKSRQDAVRAIVQGYGGHELPALATTDGVHPNAAGYLVWKQIIGGACS